MKGLIVTVERFSEPLVKSIEKLEPEVICFYYSPGSGTDVELIKKQLQHKKFKNFQFPVKDPQDFNQCFKTATNAVDALTGRNIYPNDTLLDYIGGTKIMSSALVAATLGRGFRYALVAGTLDKGFRYVYMGGERRDEDGSSFIDGGMEEVLSSNNPWDIRALESKRKIQRNFNNYRFKSVMDQIDSLKKKELRSDRDRYLLNAIRELAEGYSRWDRFHYKGVKDKLKESTEDFNTYTNLAQPESHLSFSLEKMKENINFLSKLQEETFGFNFEKRIGRSLAVDMFWNATRRAKEGKYDDGIVRLYRTVEMFGQIEIYNELGHHTNAIPLDLIPEELKGELHKKPGEDKVELGLKENFLLLSKLGNPVGEKYLEHEGEFKKIMGTRNTSFLTHNYKAIEEHQFESHKDTIAKVFDIRKKINFPKLDLVRV